MSDISAYHTMISNKIYQISENEKMFENEKEKSVSRAIELFEQEFKINVDIHNNISIEEYNKNGISFVVNIDNATNEISINVLEKPIMERKHYIKKIEYANEYYASKIPNTTKIFGHLQNGFVVLKTFFPKKLSVLFFDKLFEIFIDYRMYVFDYDPTSNTTKSSQSNIETFYIQIFNE